MANHPNRPRRGETLPGHRLRYQGRWQWRCDCGFGLQLPRRDGVRTLAQRIAQVHEWHEHHVTQVLAAPSAGEMRPSGTTPKTNARATF